MRFIHSKSVHLSFVNLLICAGIYTAFHYYTEGVIDREIIPFVGGFLMGVVILTFNSPKVQVVHIPVSVVKEEENGNANTEE